MEEVDTEELSGQRKRAFYHSGWPMWLLFSPLVGLSTALISARSSWLNTVAEGELSAPDNWELLSSDCQNLSLLETLILLSVFLHVSIYVFYFSLGIFHLNVCQYKRPSYRLIKILLLKTVNASFKRIFVTVDRQVIFTLNMQLKIS